MKLVLASVVRWSRSSSVCATAAAATSFRAPTERRPGLHAFVSAPTSRSRPITPTRTHAGVRLEPAVAGADSYDFSSRRARAFDDSSTVSYTQAPRLPVASIQLQLPWMTGNPYALWAHVRCESTNGQHRRRGARRSASTPRWRAGSAQEPAPGGARSAGHPIDGRDGLPGLVLNVPDTTRPFHDDDERRRRAGVLDVPPGRRRRRSMARARDPPRRRADSLPNGISRSRATGRGVAGLHDDEPTAPRGNAAGRRSRHVVERRLDARSADAARADARASPGPAPRRSATPARSDRSSIASTSSPTSKCVNRGLDRLDRRRRRPGRPRTRRRSRLPATIADLTSANGRASSSSFGAAERHAFDATRQRRCFRDEHARRQRRQPEPRRRLRQLPGRRLDAGGCGTRRRRGTPTALAARHGLAAGPLLLDGRAGRRPYDDLSGSTDEQPGDPLEYHDVAVPQDVVPGRVWSLRHRVAAGHDRGADAVCVRASPPGRASRPRPPEVRVRTSSPLIAWQPAIGAPTYEIQLSRRAYPWVAGEEARHRSSPRSCCRSRRGRRLVVLPRPRRQPGPAGRRAEDDAGRLRSAIRSPATASSLSSSVSAA